MQINIILMQKQIKNHIISSVSYTHTYIYIIYILYTYNTEDNTLNNTKVLVSNMVLKIIIIIMVNDKLCVLYDTYFNHGQVKIVILFPQVE